MGRQGPQVAVLDRENDSGKGPEAGTKRPLAGPQKALTAGAWGLGGRVVVVQKSVGRQGPALRGLVGRKKFSFYFKCS